MCFDLILKGLKEGQSHSWGGLDHPLVEPLVKVQIKVESVCLKKLIYALQPIRSFLMLPLKEFQFLSD